MPIESIRRGLWQAYFEACEAYHMKAYMKPLFKYSYRLNLWFVEDNKYQAFGPTVQSAWSYLKFLRKKYRG